MSLVWTPEERKRLLENRQLFAAFDEHCGEGVAEPLPVAEADV